MYTVNLFNVERCVLRDAVDSDRPGHAIATELLELHRAGKCELRGQDRRQALRDRLDAARRRLEARAKARAEAERADYEAKVAAREMRQGRAKGKHPKPPDETPRPDEQSNLSDPDSGLMRKSKNHEYRQAYNAQAVVDAGGSQLILRPGQPMRQRPQ